MVFDPGSTASRSGAGPPGTEMTMTRHLNKFCGHGRLITPSTMLMDDQHCHQDKHQQEPHQGKLMKLVRSESSLTQESHTGSSVKISQSSTSTRVTNRKRFFCEGMITIPLYMHAHSHFPHIHHIRFYIYAWHHLIRYSCQNAGVFLSQILVFKQILCSSFFPQLCFSSAKGFVVLHGC